MPRVLTEGQTILRQADQRRAGSVSTPSPLTTVALALVILAATGQFFNNVAFLRVANFAVTLPLILLGLAGAVAALIPRRSPGDDLAPLMAGIIILWTILSAVSMGVITNGEWQKSAVLFLVNALCFMLISRLQVRQQDLQRVTPILLYTIFIGGGLGIIQFLLLNYTSVLALVPEGLRVSEWDPTIDIYRSGGLLRAGGLSLEPSTFAIALSIGAVFCLFFSRVIPRIPYARLLLAGVTIAVGSFMSFSFSGWALGILPIVVGVFLTRASVRWAALFGLLVAVLVLGYLYTQDLLPGLSTRVETIASGDEESANVRVTAALTLLFWPSVQFSDFVAGYGLGMDARYASLMGQVYGRYFGVYDTNIHNTFTTVKILQGWIGVLLHIVLLLAVFRPIGLRNWSLFVPLMLMVIILHFAQGTYLDPTFWAVLALIAILRNANFTVSDPSSLSGVTYEP